MTISVNVSLPCDSSSIHELERIVAALRALYPEEAAVAEPATPQATPTPTPESSIDMWFPRLGAVSRRFWKLVAQHAVNHPKITFDDLAASSGIAKEQLRSYHRNSYRAINDKHAMDPMQGEWDGLAKRKVYEMSASVRDKILDLTRNDA